MKKGSFFTSLLDKGVSQIISKVGIPSQQHFREGVTTVRENLANLFMQSTVTVKTSLKIIFFQVCYVSGRTVGAEMI